MEYNMPISQTTPISQVNRTYPYETSVSFYALANPNYYDYYNRTVKWWGYWYDGWVPGFHDQVEGVFSTGICPSVVKIVTSLVAGQKVIFKKKGEHDDNKAIDFVSKWAEKSGFQNEYKKAINYAGAMGTSLIKLNTARSELWCEAVRFDYFYFSANARGEVESVTCMLRPYSNLQYAGSGDVENYYLVEKRYYVPVNRPKQEKINNQSVWAIEEDRQPMVIYQMCRVRGMSENKQMTPTDNGTLNWKNVPEEVKNAVRNDYGAIAMNIPQKLPFKDIGCYLLQYENDASRPTSPFGRSISANLLSYYMDYDRTFSWKYRDKYLGVGTLLVPKSLELGDIDNGWKRDIPTGQNYSFLPTVNPDKMAPLNVQFNIREQEWASSLDDDLRGIAMTLGINASTIAPHLSDASHVKTATEVDAEISMSLSYIELHRSYIAPLFDKLIECVLNFYGISENVKVKFSTPSLIDADKIIDRAMKLYQMGFIDKEGALRMINPDMDEAQIGELRKKSDAEYEKNQANNMASLGQNYGL